MRDNIVHCRFCGEQIIFIQTEKKKLMPVDPVPVYIIETPGRGSVYYESDRKQVRGYETQNKNLATNTAFEPHFKNCPHYVAARSRRNDADDAIKKRIEKERLEAAERQRRREIAAEKARIAEEARRAQLTIEEMEIEELRREWQDAR